MEPVRPSPGACRLSHLKTRAQFQAVLAGSTVAKTAHFVMHRCALDTAVSDHPLHTPMFATSQLWVGVMTPKRWAKRSVTRHLIKRHVYATAEAYAHRLGQAAYVVRQRQAFDTRQFMSASSGSLKEAVRSELMDLFEQTTASKQAQP